MFRRLADQTRATIGVILDGRPVQAFMGDSVAAVLLASGSRATRRSAISGAPRAPYCMMGVCFECLVTIEGVGNRQGCMVLAVEGMNIETQGGRREAGR